MENEISKLAIKMSCDVENSTKKLEGLMPLIKLKVDTDLFYLIDLTIQQNLMAVASFDAAMKNIKS